MGPRDWAFLVSLCDPEVQAMYARRGMEGSPFTKLHMGLRKVTQASTNRAVEGVHTLCLPTIGAVYHATSSQLLGPACNFFGPGCCAPVTPITAPT